MKWSAALFGHDKPKYYVQDSESGLNLYTYVEHPGEMPEGMRLHQCVGLEKRAVPGDVIALRPDKCWTCDTNQHTEIVGMIRNPAYLAQHKEYMREKFLERCVDKKSNRPAERFERIWKDKIARFGLHDPHWLPEEVRRYFSYLPGSSLWHLNGKDVWGKQERKLFLIADFDGIETDQLTGITEPMYDVAQWPEDEPVPTDYLKKRRINIPIEALSGKGVELDKMLDPQIEYTPEVEVCRTEAFDKVKNETLKEDVSLSPIKRETFDGLL